MTYCEDYPACGHHSDDPCDVQWYDAPDAFDVSVNPHAFCDHEYGICEADFYEDDEIDPEDCDHGDTSFNVVERDGVAWRTDRECDRCYYPLEDIPDED